MDDTEIRFLAVKRKLFEKLYGRLNPPQREAVLSVNGPLLVFAGAGSGKTTVLVNRVAQIIRYGNAYASRRIPEGLSLQTVEALEDSLGHSIPDGEIGKLQTVQELVDYCNK